MKYALDPAGGRLVAEPGMQGVCPVCGQPLLARCGELKVWHWAHHKREDCDPWYEPETEWHRGWKALVPPDRTEVTMGEHRADIVGVRGMVIELQHSSISPEEIRLREAFYGQMIWLLDGSAFRGQFRMTATGSFHWAHARPSWIAATKYRFIHGFSLGHLFARPNPFRRQVDPAWNPLAESDQIFQILKMSNRAPYVGNGRMITIEQFREKLLGNPEPGVLASGIVSM